MKGKYTLFLLVLNLVVLGIILYQYHLRSQDADERLRQTPLLTIDPENADFLEVVSPDTAPRILEKKGSQWMLESPQVWRANPYAINRLLSELRLLNPRTRFSLSDSLAMGQSLETYGFDSPRLTVTIGRGDRRETIRFGHSTVGDGVYLLGPDGETIYVSHVSLLESFLMPMAELRSSEIFTIQAFEVEGLAVRRQESEDRQFRTNLRKTNGGWSFETPIRAQAASERVEESLQRLLRARPSEFIEADTEDFPKYGLEEGKLSIRIEGNNRQETLIVGNPVGEDETMVPSVYARLSRTPSVFVLPERILQRFKDPLSDFRERRILHFRGQPPQEMMFREGDRELSLRKLEEGVWQYLKQEPNGEFRPESADLVLVEFLLELLHRIEVEEFVLDAPTQEDLERFGLTKPKLEIHLREPGEVVLQIGESVDEESVFARKRGEPFVYQLPSGLLNWITSDPLFYRDRIIQRLPSGANIQMVQMRSGDTRNPWLAWSAQASDESDNEEQQKLIGQLLQNLREFEVDTYLAEEFWPNFKLDEDLEIPWEHRLQVRWSLRGDEEGGLVERTFLFSPAYPDGSQYGTSPDLAVTFLLTQEWVDLLDRLEELYAPRMPELGPPVEDAPRDPATEPRPAVLPTPPVPEESTPETPQTEQQP